MDFYNFVTSPFLLPVVKVKARDKKQSIFTFPLENKMKGGFRKLVKHEIEDSITNTYHHQPD